MATTPDVRTIGQLVEAVDLAIELQQNQGGQPVGGGAERIVEAIYLPIFQRFPVWDKQKRRNFIESIHEGLPVGSLLVHREFIRERHAQLTLIDGLQRMTAIREYVKAPLEYNRYRQVPGAVRAPLEDALTSVGVDLSDLDAAMDAWFAAVKRTDFPSGFRPDRLQIHLGAVLDVEGLAEHAGVDEAIALFLHRLEEWVDISEYLMPVLVYEGSEEKLATAFELLNSAGSALSKYDIYAAQWATDLTLIRNETIRTEARAKYQAWEDAGWAIDFPEGMDGPDEHNLYEYLLGLGRTLTLEFPSLFASPAALETESTGFVLASIAFGLKPTKSQMPGLPAQMPRQGNAIDPHNFEDALFEAARVVEGALRRFLQIRLNTATGNPSYDHAHSELLMASLICSALVRRFDPEGGWEERPEWRQERRQFERSIAQHYVVDILDGTWSGAGDTLAFDRVWVTDDNGVSTGQPSDHYLRELERPDIARALDSWFDRESFPREQLRRGSIRAVEKLLLRIIYSGVLLAAEDLDPAQGFDIEHIYPVKRVSDAIGQATRGWPISCLSNLMLLDRQLNRDKREMTLREAIEDITDPQRREQTTASVERFLFLDVGRIVVDGDINPVSELPNPTRPSYEEFLRTRWEELRERAVNALSPNVA